MNEIPAHQFLNCEMEFECPKSWFELTETNKAGVKHCGTCNKNVHLCANQDELDEFALKGECIAFFSDPDRPTRFKLAREKAEANKRTDEFKIESLILGLPRSANRGMLSFNEDFEKGKNKSSEGK